MAQRGVARGIVVIGASAGGVEVLRRVVRDLVGDLPAAVFTVLHVARSGSHPLAAILDRAGPLPAQPAGEGQWVQPGRIAVAPSDRHLVLSGGRMHLSDRPAHNGHRPAIDALFRSAAREYGPEVVGVVLSGDGDDGAAGLATVARLGGLAIVQDPAEAAHRSMPSRALRSVPDAHVASADKIGGLVVDAVAGASELGRGSRRPTARTPRERNEDFEAALSLAVQALEDRARLTMRMARNHRTGGNGCEAGRYDELTEEYEWAITVLRQSLRERDRPAPANDTTRPD